MGVIYNKPMMMYCDNQATMYIANNLVFHKRMRHLSRLPLYQLHGDDTLDSHFVVTSSSQLEDIFIKALFRKSFAILCSMLGMIDIYALA